LKPPPNAVLLPGSGLDFRADKIDELTLSEGLQRLAVDEERRRLPDVQASDVSHILSQHFRDFWAIGITLSTL
jgi:hypothetical protein